MQGLGFTMMLPRDFLNRHPAQTGKHQTVCGCPEETGKLLRVWSIHGGVARGDLAGGLARLSNGQKEKAGG